MTKIRVYKELGRSGDLLRGSEKNYMSESFQSDRRFQPEKSAGGHLPFSL